MISDPRGYLPDEEGEREAEAREWERQQDDRQRDEREADFYEDWMRGNTP